MVLTFPLTTTQVTYDVSTADNTSNTYDIGVLNSSGNVVAHIGSTAGTTFAREHGMEDVELGCKRDAAAGEVLSGDHEQLYEFVRAGLRREFGWVHVRGRKQRNGGERDGGRDAEQWDHDSGG